MADHTECHLQASFASRLSQQRQADKDGSCAIGCDAFIPELGNVLFCTELMLITCSQRDQEERGSDGTAD